jgi:general stress protein CsbA
MKNYFKILNQLKFKFFVRSLTTTTFKLSIFYLLIIYSCCQLSVVKCRQPYNYYATKQEESYHKNNHNQQHKPKHLTESNQKHDSKNNDNQLTFNNNNNKYSEHVIHNNENINNLLFKKNNNNYKNKDYSQESIESLRDQFKRKRKADSQIKQKQEVEKEEDEEEEEEEVVENYYLNDNMTFDNNLTMNITSERPSILSIGFTAIICLAMILCTLIGNVTVILAVVLVRKLHTQENANNFLIVSLAVSDFLVGLLVMPYSLYVELSPDHK